MKALHIQWRIGAGTKSLIHLIAPIPEAIFFSLQKCRLKSITTNGWRHFGQLEQCKSSVLFSIQSQKSPDSRFFACDL